MPESVGGIRHLYVLSEMTFPRPPAKSSKYCFYSLSHKNSCLEKYFNLPRICYFAALLDQIQNSPQSSEILFPTSSKLTNIAKSHVEGRKSIVAQSQTEDSLTSSPMGRRKHRATVGLSTRCPQKSVRLQKYILENVQSDQPVSGDIADQSTLTGSEPTRHLKSKWLQTNVAQITARNIQETVELSPSPHDAEVLGMKTDDFQACGTFIEKANQSSGNFIVKMYK